MKSLLGVFLVTIATPALAQHNHGAAVQQAPADPHAQHQMDEKSADPHAGHDMPPKPSEPTDPHAGHQMPSAPATDAHHAHAGHEPGIPDPPVGPPSAAALSGPSHAADAFFGAATMAPAREVVRKEHGDIKRGMILIDQPEAVIGKGQDGYAWNAQGWYGGAIERLWFKPARVSSFGERLESVEEIGRGTCRARVWQYE